MLRLYVYVCVVLANVSVHTHKHDHRLEGCVFLPTLLYFEAGSLTKLEEH